jgi:protein-L-isoaspartate O-methyltransferase
MVIPVGPHGYQQIIRVVKDAVDGKITTEPLLDVRYVPLTAREKQWGY